MPIERTRGSASGRYALALGLAALLVSGCASMQERTSTTENRIGTLEAQVADLQASQQEIIARLTQLRSDIEQSLDPMRTQQADRGEGLRAARREISSLEQQLLLMGNRIDELIDQVAALQGLHAGSGQTPTIPNRNAGDNRRPARGSEADEIFDSAFLDYMNANYVLAIDGFQEFLSRYPNSTQAPKALYWLGESLAAQGDHEAARARFLEIVRRYPSADNVADAALRAALESIDAGNTAEGIAEIRRLIDTYPGSDAVLVGCMQLDRLDEPLPDACRAG